MADGADSRDLVSVLAMPTVGVFAGTVLSHVISVADRFVVLHKLRQVLHVEPEEGCLVDLRPGVVQLDRGIGELEEGDREAKSRACKPTL